MEQKAQKLARAFYLRDARLVAKELLGKVLVHHTGQGVRKGRIVEVEAYLGAADAAAHAYKGRTKRTEVQYGPGGFAYLFQIYGMHTCMNVVTNQENQPEAVLLRALEPLEGISAMQPEGKIKPVKDLCNGPGKLCRAMGIGKECYGADLCGDNLYLEDDGFAMTEDTIEASKRINIDYAGEAKDYEWRFFLKGNPCVSTFKSKKDGPSGPPNRV